ncbi:MAG: hypothetical protein HY958_06625 [Bacteroidia bacterium]|nr:hypothetical protein [Bacteroidia bacterium]
MRTITLIFVIFLTINCQLSTINCFGQAAGNWMINQSNADYKYSEKGSYDKINYENEYGGKAAALYYKYPTYTAIEKDTVIVLETNVLMNVKAESYMAIFGVSQVSEKIETCHEMINGRIMAFINSLKAIGINPDDTYIDFISQVPVFEIEVEKKLFSKSYNEVPKGFEVKKNIHIKYKDQKIAEKLLVEAAKNEIYDIVKVDYIVNNNEAIYDSLRNISIRLMNKKVKEFKKLGIKFEALYQSVTEDISSTYPLERYSRYAAFNDPSISVVTKSSKYSQTPSRNVSLYYNKLPYNEFDMVVNPVVIDPVVQYAFKLKMKYVLKKQ